MNSSQNRLALLSAIALSCALAGCATSTPSLPPVNIPAALQVPNGQQPSIKALASGVQIYTCAPADTGSQNLAWHLDGPEAELHDIEGHPVAKHYAGPTWEADDGSKVAGLVVAQDAGPDTNAIPWLLLQAKSHTGSGKMAGIKWIQRVYTAGGKPSPAACNAAAAQQTVRVPYTATYFFYSQD